MQCSNIVSTTDRRKFFSENTRTKELYLDWRSSVSYDSHAWYFPWTQQLFVFLNISNIIQHTHVVFVASFAIQSLFQLRTNYFFKSTGSFTFGKKNHDIARQLIIIPMYMSHSLLWKQSRRMLALSWVGRHEQVLTCWRSSF